MNSTTNDMSFFSLSRSAAVLLLIVLSLFLSSTRSYGNDFVLLFTNDARGEIDPCG